MTSPLGYGDRIPLPERDPGRHDLVADGDPLGGIHLSIHELPAEAPTTSPVARFGDDLADHGRAGIMMRTTRAACGTRSG